MSKQRRLEALERALSAARATNPSKHLLAEAMQRICEKIPENFSIQGASPIEVAAYLIQHDGQRDDVLDYARRAAVGSSAPAKLFQAILNARGKTA